MKYSSAASQLGSENFFLSFHFQFYRKFSSCSMRTHSYCMTLPLSSTPFYFICKNKIVGLHLFYWVLHDISVTFTEMKNDFDVGLRACVCVRLIRDANNKSLANYNGRDKLWIPKTETTQTMATKLVYR